MLTRFDDCLDAFSDWRTWSSQRRGNLMNDLPERIGRTLGTTDPPRHTMARKLVNKAFTQTTVAVLEPRVRALAVELADRAATEGDIEFVKSRLPELFKEPEKRFLTAAALENAAQRRRYATPAT